MLLQVLLKGNCFYGLRLELERDQCSSGIPQAKRLKSENSILTLITSLATKQRNSVGFLFKRSQTAFKSTKRLNEDVHTAVRIFCLWRLWSPYPILEKIPFLMLWRHVHDIAKVHLKSVWRVDETAAVSCNLCTAANIFWCTHQVISIKKWA